MTVVIGTAGHIDHGKTTLLRALTGIDADRLPEERRRGMTIDVGYAHLALEDGSKLDFVDVPGHDRLIGNMLVGAGEIDAVMLVVAADDGPRAQTLEHLELLDALAIDVGVAVVTKTDIAGPARSAEVAAAVGRRLAETTLRGSPVLAVSPVDGSGLDELRTALVDLRDRVLARTAPRPGASRGTSRLAIDRSFTVKGRGAVVTGTLRGGPLRRGSSLRLVPGDVAIRAREIQVHGATVDAAEPGRAAINVAGVEAAALHRGLVLTDDPAVGSSDRLLVRLARPLPDRARGVSRRRQTPERIAILAAAVDASDAVAADAARIGLHGAVVALDGAVRLAPDVIDALDGEVPSSLPETGSLSLPAVRSLVERRLRRRVTLDRGTAARAASDVVDGLIRAGRLERNGPDVTRPGWRPDRAIDPAVVAAMDRLEAALGSAAPPPLTATARAAGCPPAAIREMERAGRLVLLEPDLAYAATTYRDLTAQALALATAGPLTPAALRDVTGTSRRYAMAILEDLDRRGILRRTEAGHVPGPRSATAAEVAR
ncbi:MAG: selenocysteine-specific translation elongation factor [Chloroflexi bacterium]|nr:selenocysteine-specific translation elongation factor [Chloroflexota bacterium]